MTAPGSAIVHVLKRDLDGTHPLVVIDSDDELEIRDALFAAVDPSIPYRRWTAVQSLASARLADAKPIADTETAVAALVWLTTHAGGERSVAVFYDLAAHLAEPRTLRALREAIAWARMTFGVSTPLP